MINIIEQSKEFSKVELYLLTASPEVVSMKTVEDNTVIPIDGYIIYEDTKENGDNVTIMAIKSTDNQFYGLQSQTFIRSLKEINSLMAGESYSIKKISGVTKGGRDYINCVLSV